MYDRAYYNGGRGAYRRYEYAPKWKRRAASLLRMFPDADTFLDAACARGFLLKGYVESGVAPSNVCGFDISEWAVENADPTVRERVRCCSVFDFRDAGRWDLVTAFDFLEHIERDRLPEAVAILEGSAKRHLHVMLMVEKAAWDNDETHVSILSQDEWLGLFSMPLVNIQPCVKAPHVLLATFGRKQPTQ